jgi:hypothetical protein
MEIARPVQTYYLNKIFLLHALPFLREVPEGGRVYSSTHKTIRYLKKLRALPVSKALNRKYEFYKLELS